MPFAGLLEKKLPGTDGTSTYRLTPHASTDIGGCTASCQTDSPRRELCAILMYKHAQVRVGSTRVLTLIFVAVGAANRTPQSQTAGNSAKAPRSLLR